MVSMLWRTVRLYALARLNLRGEFNVYDEAYEVFRSDDHHRNLGRQGNWMYYVYEHVGFIESAPEELQCFGVSH